jgi:hypothetical protein
MKVLLIILAVYVALDIITGLYIYITLRIKGWPRYEMARRFKMLMHLPCEDYNETIKEELEDTESDWE